MKDKILKILKSSVWYIPFAVLAIALVTGAFLGLLHGEEMTKTDEIRIVSMVAMTGFCLILALLKKSLFNRITGYVAFIAAAPCFFLLVEFYTHNPFTEKPVMKTGIMVLNILLFFFALLALAMITTRISAAISTVAVVTCVFGFVNYLSMQFRSLPVYPWDIASAGTAISVLDNFDIVITPHLFFTFFCFAFAICVSFLCDSSLYLKKWWAQLTAAALAVAAFAGMFIYVRSDYAEKKYGYYPYLFSEAYLYKYNGVAVTMTWTTKYLSVEKPSGYSLSEIRGIYEKYKGQAQASDQDPKVTPNIIVVMNEAWSDPLALCMDFETNVDYMPYLHSLQQNGGAATGYVTVSVKGGNTPNSEFEFLTGMSMAFLPAGSIPYQQFVKGDIENLTTQLEEMGYTSVGMHPYYSSGWKRNVVYPKLGFDRIMFQNDFKYRSKVRAYISDGAMFQQINQLITSNDTGKPMFVFGVTMQNHSAYTTEYDNFSPDVKVSGSAYRPLEQYLSLMKISDLALESFIKYVDENFSEPTVVLMFGDHQPNDNVYAPIYRINKLNDDLNSSDPEIMLRRYMTPYVMWANYDVDLSSMPELTSVNYLAGQMLSALGLDLTAFQKWQLEAQKKIPVLCANGYYDGQWHTLEDMSDGTLVEYSKIQYNYLFGKKSTLTELFRVYPWVQ